MPFPIKLFPFPIKFFPFLIESSLNPEQIWITDRRTVVELVPLTYPRSLWVSTETDRLRDVVRQSCQQRCMELIDQQEQEEAVAEEDEDLWGLHLAAAAQDVYARRVNELRTLTLEQLLKRLEENGRGDAAGGASGESSVGDVRSHAISRGV